MEQSFGSTPSEEIPPPPPPINLSFPLIGIPFLISMRFDNLVFVIFTFSVIAILVTIRWNKYLRLHIMQTIYMSLIITYLTDNDRSGTNLWLLQGIYAILNLIISFSTFVLTNIFPSIFNRVICLRHVRHFTIQ